MKKGKQEKDLLKNHDKYCAICGKYMFIFNFKDYAYKRDNKYYCSWTCYTKGVKKRGRKKNKKGENHDR